MSRHEGVSCDACLKANFRGRRYKCLICYDYDLCSSCYESGSTTSRHTIEHPMQCILTRHDFDIFHGGEALTVDTPQSLTCPFCCKMGYTETSLQEHVAATHPDSAFEVVCPICASVPGGEPNHVTDDFAAHLTIDHRSGGSRDLDVSESSGRQGARRVNHQGRGLNRGVARQNMRSVGGGFFSSSPRESMDPIAELLSQLSGVRRATATTRQQQQLERLPARRSANNRDATSSAEVISNQSTSISSQTGTTASNTNVSVSLTSTNNVVTSSNQSVPVPALVQSSTSKQTGQQSFLIPRLNDSEPDSEVVNESHNQAAFIQELLLSTLSELSLGALSSLEEEQTTASQEEVEATSVDVSTQTPASSHVALGSPLSSSNVPPFHMKNPPMPVAPPINKKKMVGRGPSPLQIQSPNGANQGRIGSGANTPVGRGNSRPQSGGGAVSPTSRRKPMRGVEGGRLSQPPPPH